MAGSNFRGESRPRRQPSRHHITTFASAHKVRDVTDPFPPLNNSQFPSLYIRSPMKNAYRSYMRAKSPFSKRPKA